MAIPFKFIQCGDLHLGAPFKRIQKLGAHIGSDMVRATFRSFENIVSIAIDERVNAVLITGDVYDSKSHNLEAQARFVKECERLERERIPVYLVQGNHDVADSWGTHMTLPNNVHVFSSHEVERHSLVVRGQEVAGIYGQSLNSHNVHMNVASQIRPLHTDPFSIALLHGSVGVQPHHEVTAPVTLEELRISPISYWAVGHIHQRSILSERPYVVYAGNTQGLHRHEQGPKGCYVVQVQQNGDVEFQFRETGLIRFEEVRIDISKLDSLLDVTEMIRHKKEMLRKSKRHILLRLIFEGQGHLHDAVSRPELRKLWMDEANEEEHNAQWIMIYGIDDTTVGDIDVSVQRHMPGMGGDYIRSYDKMIDPAGHVKLDALREVVNERSEMKRLGEFSKYITDDMLEEAFRRAERRGLYLLVGEGDED